MRNPKLVPYEIIVRATSGEPEAIDECTGDNTVKLLKRNHSPSQPWMIRLHSLPFPG